MLHGYDHTYKYYAVKLITKWTSNFDYWKENTKAQIQFMLLNIQCSQKETTTEIANGLIMTVSDSWLGGVTSFQKIIHHWLNTYFEIYVSDANSTFSAILISAKLCLLQGRMCVSSNHKFLYASNLPKNKCSK